MKPFVNKLSRLKFEVFYPGKPDKLILDFQPILQTLEPEFDGCLIHWQAKPRIERQWGIWCDGNYSCGKRGTIAVSSAEMMQLDERHARTVPTAVLVVRNSRVIDDDHFLSVVDR